MALRRSGLSSTRENHSTWLVGLVTASPGQVACQPACPSPSPPVAACWSKPFCPTLPRVDLYPRSSWSTTLDHLATTSTVSCRATITPLSITPACYRIMVSAFTDSPRGRASPNCKTSFWNSPLKASGGTSTSVTKMLSSEGELIRHCQCINIL